MIEPSPLPTTRSLLSRVDAMAGRPLVMAIDLVADRFITGVPRRISREAPVLILSYEGERLLPGGGANAVANVAALGGRPLPLGVVGDDDSGRQLTAALADLGVTCEGILVRRGYRTPTKTRILGGGAIKQQIVRYDIEDWLELDDQERTTRRRQLERWAGQTGDLRVAVLSDYGYGSVEPSLTGDLRTVLGSSGVLICDSRHRLGDFVDLDGATPNQEEAEFLLGNSLDIPQRQLEVLGQALRGKLGARFLLITRGSRGMSLFRDGSSVHLPVHGTDQVADVTGAGDTVIGTFALALASGADTLEAALLANYAGGVVVMKMGTATLSPEELRQAVVSDPGPLAALA